MESNITLPTSWAEINIKTFQEMSLIDDKDKLLKTIELISVLSDKDPEEIKQYNAIDLEKILNTIQWTNQSPTNEYKTHLVIEEKNYYLVKLSTLSLGEWVDLDTWCEDSINNLHKIFALLYREEGEGYDANNLRSELFLDKLMIEDVYGTLIFFLAIASQYYLLIQDFTKS